MKYFIFLFPLIFYINDSIAQLDIEVNRDKKIPVKKLLMLKKQSQQLPQPQQPLQEEKKENVEEDFNSKVFKRNIYGRYDNTQRAIKIEDKVSDTVLHSREDFKDRIRNSLGKY